MSKIGIVTLYGNYNYGNKLQNFAMEQILKEKGHKVESIVCPKGSVVKHYLKHLYNIIVAIFKHNPDSLRYVNFLRFNRKYLSIKIVSGKNGNVNDDTSKEYDYFVAGSDQVWNPDLRKNQRKTFFLQFANPEQRIAIAPSIAYNEIPEQFREEYSRYLKNFKNLSCRESFGAIDIAKITSNECQHIIDPTLVLDDKKWRECEIPLNIKKDYIVVMFYGDLKSENQEKINAYAKLHDYEIITPCDKKSPYFSINPFEFVWLIDNAKMVFTDSFHAVAFSINLNTPLYVLNRNPEIEVFKNITSRISSIVSVFKLESRYVENELGDISEDCDFSEANSIILKEREKFYDYIKKCFE